MPKDIVKFFREVKLRHVVITWRFLAPLIWGVDFTIALQKMPEERAYLLRGLRNWFIVPSQRLFSY